VTFGLAGVAGDTHHEFGGGGFPWLVAVVMQEMMASASMAFSRPGEKPGESWSSC
jgi:hypothetical protein